MPLSPASSAFAIGLTGDLAGVTFVQRAQNRRTAYAKTYPKRKPSGTQKLFRARFAEAIKLWRELDEEHKTTLDLICQKNQMVMSGFNLYISCYMNRRLSWLTDWASQINRAW